ncbi:MAG TPA: hypothetical protein VMM27_13205 [Casimicrobiaceae bacterium]|nr:hypothetical protein [Casimicrobiaceae bacterium]
MSTRRQFLRRTGYALAVAADGRLLAPQAGAAAVADPHCAQAAALPQPRAAAVGVPIVTQLWDGTTGVSGDWFNYGAALPWENQGGDWSDANAIAQGPTAFASMSFSSPGSSSASITTLARRWYAQGNTGVLLKPTNANAALVATRLNPDAALAPAVTLTLSDGTLVTCECIGSAAANLSSYLGSPGPTAPVQNGSAFCLQFNLPSIGSRSIASATLKVTATQVFGALVVAVLELRPPRIFDGGTPTYGLAAKYPQDVGIAANASVILATQFTDAGWNTRLEFPGYVAPDAVVAMDAALGTPAINVQYHVGEFSPFSADHEFSTKPVEQQGPNDCPSEVYFRYYLKLKPGYQCSTDGKKLPGLAGRYGYWDPVGYYQPIDGNGGSPTRGTKIPYAQSPSGYYLSGWSMRSQAGVGPSDANPYGGLVVVNTYAYHAAMATSFGDVWRWGNWDVGFVNLTPDQWYCVEQYVRINTVTGPFDSLGNGVGLPDGVIRAWVDGVLVFEKTNVLYRKHPAIKIDEVWLDHYHGGTTPAEAVHPFAMANLVVAKEYVGPMKGNQATANAWPFMIPASGTRGVISSNVLTDVAAASNQAVAGESVAFMQFSMQKVLGAWGSSAVSLIRDGSGSVVDIVYWIFGGGHGDAGWDGVCAWRASTGKFEVMLPPSKWNVSVTLDPEHGENIANRPDSQHAYQNIYGLDSDEPNGPSLLVLRGSAIGQGAVMSGWAHRFDAGTKQWSRFGANFGVPHTAAPYLSAFVKDPARKRFVRYPSNNGAAYASIDYGTGTPAWLSANQRASRSANWTDMNMPCGAYDPIRDLYLVGCWAGGSGLYAVPAGDPAAPFSRLKEAGIVPSNIVGTALIYRSARREFVLIDSAAQPPTRIYVLTPPTGNPLTAEWTWTTRAFTGPASMFVDESGGTWFNRWQYVEALDALIACPAAGAPMECWKL